MLRMLRRNPDLSHLIGFIGFWVLTLCFVGWGAVGSLPQAWAASPGELVALSDEEMGQVSAGVFEMTLEDFNVAIHENSASRFTMDISQFAFEHAQGVFTTLQTVNSAIDLNVVVNIYVNHQSSL